MLRIEASNGAKPVSSRAPLIESEAPRRYSGF